MKRGLFPILASVASPAALLGLAHASAAALANNYLGLGLLRAALAPSTTSLRWGLLLGIGSGLAAALLGPPLVSLLSGLLRRLPGVLAGLLLAAAAAGLAWGGARLSMMTGLHAALRAHMGSSGAVAALAATAALAAGLLFLTSRRPAATGALASILAVCLFAWGAALATLRLTRAESGPGRPPVILISLDTVRADRTGLYGYERPTTPALDAFAADAVTFGAAIAASPWTLPSHASILTSLHPHNHGSVMPTRRLRESAVSLAEVLLDRGYETAAFTGSGYVSTKFGLAQGFETFVEMRHRETGAIVERALEWLDARSDRPFFLFLHTYEPHSPYRDGRFADAAEAGSVGETFDRKDLEALREGTWDPSPEERRYVSDLYDGDIRSTDEALGVFLHALRDRGLLDRSLVVVASDHGEEMFERNVRRSAGHGHSLYEELIRVPLVVRHPPAFAGGRRVAAPAALVDVPRTIAGALGIPWPDRSDGLDLRVLLSPGPAPGREVVLSEALRSGAQKRSLRGERFKFIVPLDPAGGEVELFDLAEDPREATNLAGARADLSERYARLAAAYEAAHAAGEEAIIDPELHEQLRALGYVQ